MTKKVSSTLKSSSNSIAATESTDAVTSSAGNIRDGLTGDPNGGQMSVVETKAFLKFSWASLLLTADYSVNYEGASYYFASAENLETFKADPAKYIPQHGGFCSYGVSVGKKFDGDPDQFVVHDGQLFLFLNAKTRELFLEDITGVKATADTNWEAIERIAVGEL